MSNVIHLGDLRDVSENLKPDAEDFATQGATPDDNSLLKEGLDLLCAYRSIPDERIRLSVKRLVEDMASVYTTRGRR